MKGGIRSTIKDIAEKAGVSKTTVSFAFNAPWKISADTRDRVLQVAEELEYIPDPVARTLTTKRTGTIGLLLPQPIQDAFKNPHIFELVQGIGSVCHAEGFSLTILPPVKGLLSQTVRTAAVDVIITIGIGPDTEVLQLIRKRHLCFVTIDGAPDSGALNVGIDDEAGGYTLMAHLLALGHRRIDILGLRNTHELLINMETVTMSRSLIMDVRMQGIKRALDEYADQKESFSVRTFRCDAAADSAEQTVGTLLDQADPPTAVLCLSDVAALGVYMAARKRQLKIPTDISVVGFDGILFSSLLVPPLTTMVQPGYEKGRAAARLVLNALRGIPCGDVNLDASLRVGGSTAPPRKT